MTARNDRRTSVWLVGILLGTAGFGQQVIERQADRPNYYSETLVIPAAKFTPNTIRKYFERTLLREKRDLVLLLAYPDPERMAYFWSAKLTDNMPYRTWLKCYEDRKDGPWPYAEMIAIWGAGRILVRTANDRVEQFMIGAPDTTGLLSGTGGGRLLDVSRSDLPFTKDIRITFWIQTSLPLNAETGQRFLSRVSGLPFEQVSIAVRNDPWFISDPGFPVFDLFQPALRPPTHLEYSRTSTLHCSRPSGAGDTCVVYSELWDRPH